MKETNKKKLKGVATLALAAALLVTGSLAWQDVSQHKTNNFATKSVAHSMVLVEDFDPIEGWTLGQEIRKEVSVRNGQESDNTTRFAYNDGYVRLQVREFMGIAAQTYVTHPDRLMIQTNGDFYRFEVEQDALDKADDLIIAQSRVVEVQGINDDKPYFYIESAAGDANGQYGKFLITEITTGDTTSIVDDSVVTDLDEDVTDKHNLTDGSNLEDSNIYSTHLWAEGQDNYTPTANKFTEYVKWTLGADVITLQQWKDNYHSKPVAKWIVDTSDVTNGYVYWGQRLDHATNASATSLTSKLLEKVTLIKQPQGHAEYRIHVNMDAVSYDDLGKWTDGNSDIMDAYKNNVELADLLAELQKTIDRGVATDVSGMSPDTIQALNDAIQAGKDVLTAGGPTTQDVKDAIKDINDAIGGLKVSYKVKLEELLPKAKLVDLYFKDFNKAINFKKAVEASENILLSSTATEQNYQPIYKSLEDAYSEIKDLKAVENLGDSVYISGRRYTFVKHNDVEKEALVLSDEMSLNEITDLNLNINTMNPNGIQYVNNSPIPGPYVHYSNSNLKLVVDAYHNKYITGSEHEKYVLPAEVNEMPSISDNYTEWLSESNYPTLVDENNGVIGSFALSVSDINTTVNGAAINPANLSGPNRFWLRSQDYADLGAATIEASTIKNHGVGYYAAVRSAMWVKQPVQQ